MDRSAGFPVRPRTVIAVASGIYMTRADNTLEHLAPDGRSVSRVAWPCGESSGTISVRGNFIGVACNEVMEVRPVDSTQRLFIFQTGPYSSSASYAVSPAGEAFAAQDGVLQKYSPTGMKIANASFIGEATFLKITNAGHMVLAGFGVRGLGTDLEIRWEKLGYPPVAIATSDGGTTALAGLPEPDDTSPDTLFWLDANGVVYQEVFVGDYVTSIGIDEDLMTYATAGDRLIAIDGAP